MVSTLLASISLTVFQDEPMKIVDRTARVEVQKMFDTYANCETYSDSGCVLGDEDSKVRFITRFKRPDKFYLEFTTRFEAGVGRCVLWITGPQKWFKVEGPAELGDYSTFDYSANTWYGLKNELVTTRHFGLATWGFVGISGGAAHTVPRMLFPYQIGGVSYGDMDDMIVEKRTKLNGIQVTVLYSNKHNTRIWIDSNRHLLLKEEDVLDVTTYDPVVNRPIPDSQLTFIPPVTSGRHTLL